MALATLTTKGQVTIPKEVRDSLHLHSGDKIEFFVKENGEAVIRPICRKVDDVYCILSAHDISTPAAPFLPMAALKNLAVDCYSGVFSPCPRQKINHRNAKNSHAKSIRLKNIKRKTISIDEMNQAIKTRLKNEFL